MCSSEDKEESWDKSKGESWEKEGCEREEEEEEEEIRVYPTTLGQGARGRCCSFGEYWRIPDCGT